MQQPGKRGGGGAIHRAISKIAAALCTGQRHIQQPQILGELLFFGAGLMDVKLFRAKIHPEAVVVRNVMEKNTRRLLGFQRALPGKGDEHYRILQALAGMHRHNPHAVVVAFQTQQRRLFRPRGVLAHGGKPIQHGRDVRMTGSPGGDTFGKMQQVGQAALAISETCHTRQYLALGHQLSKHPHEPISPPTLVPMMKACKPDIPSARIRLERKQLRDIQPHQVGHKCPAQQGLAARLGNRLKNALKLHRFKGVEDAFVALAHAGNPGCAKGVLHGHALNVIAHEHGDILRTKLLAAKRRARIVQPPDFAGDGRTALRPGDAFGDGPV